MKGGLGLLFISCFCFLRLGFGRGKGKNGVDDVVGGEHLRRGMGLYLIIIFGLR